MTNSDPIYIQYIRTDPENSGGGDTIKAAFDKVNENFTSLYYAGVRSDSLFPNLADPTTVSVGNLSVTTQVIGNLQLGPGSTILVFDANTGSMQPVATTATSFQGGTVQFQSFFIDTNDSFSSNTGAVIISGGLGVGKNIFAGGSLSANGVIFANSTIDSTNLSNGGLIAKGGAAIAKNLRVGGSAYISGQMNVSTTNISSLGVVIGATTPSTNVGNGALVVSGGAGILGELNVGGTATFSNSVIFSGDVNITGNTSFNTNSFYVSDNIFEVNQPQGGLLFSDNGKDVGSAFRYYNGTEKTAFFGLNNTTKEATFIIDGSEGVDGKFTGILGTMRIGSMRVSNSTVSTSYTSGAVIISGGVGIGGNLHVNQNITTNSDLLVGDDLAVTGDAGVNGTLTAVGGIYGNIATSSQPFITSVGTLTTLNVQNTANFNNITAVSVGNAATQYTGTVLTSSQPYITEIGTITNLTIGGSITPSANISADLGSPSRFYKDIYARNAYIAENTITKNATVSQLLNGNVITATTIGGTLTTASQPNITSVGVLTGVISSGTVRPSANSSVSLGDASNWWSQIYTNNITSGNVTMTNLTVSNSIKPSTNNAISLGSTTAWWSSVYGKSVHAQYADLAELYTPDAPYQPATVVVFGGDNEITVCSEFACSSVAGVVSSNPAYVMNAMLENGIPIALRGRVPVRVVGQVKKGDLLVTADIPGCGVSVGRDATFGKAVFAKSLENKEYNEEGIIEAVVL